MQASSPESAFVRAEGPHAPFTEGVEFAVGASLDYSHGVLREVGVDASGKKQELATLIENALTTAALRSKRSPGRCAPTRRSSR